MPDVVESVQEMVVHHFEFKVMHHPGDRRLCLGRRP